MKKTNIFYTLALMMLAALPLVSCDDYLDTMPDNRTEIDSEEKVVKLLTSAYPTSGSHLFIAEMMSDNVDDNGRTFTAYTDRFSDQVYNWREITETDNDGDFMFWVSSYAAIAAANKALESIEELTGGDASQMTNILREAKGEALLCRAYNHFMLANLFCLNYSSKTSTTDLGIPYVEATEKTLSPTYTRGTVAEVYEKIERDLVEGLALVGDTHLDVPKYHFNKQAAYAFAARFYLYYEKWDESIRYANLCIGKTPSTMLRDWSELAALPDWDAITRAYIDTDSKSNIMMQTSVSVMGLWCNGMAYRSKYSHNENLAETETFYAKNIWGSYDEYAAIHNRSIYKGALWAGKRGPINIVFTPKLPCLFEELDEVNHTGYYRSVYPVFKADLTLLERAEAYVMTNEYDKAAADLTLWMRNFTRSTMTLNPDTIQNFYKGMEYYTWDAPTQKKHLNPAFDIDEEGSVQESMLQQVLTCKRLETSYEGYRWFDIKRYGIKIYRRTLDATGLPVSITDELDVDDPRRAMQIPQDAITVGLQPNDRVDNTASQYVSKVEPSSSTIK